MMKDKLWLGVSLVISLVILGIGQAQNVFAASGYKATINYMDSTFGLFIYYDDSVAAYTDIINNALNTTLAEDVSEYGISASDYGAVDGSTTNQMLTTLLSSAGPSAYGWNNGCLGVYVHKANVYGTSTVKADLFAIGINYQGISFPFLYIGSFEINESLLSQLSQL